MNNRSLMNVLKLSLFLILSGALSACAVKDELVGSRWVVVGKIEVPPNAFGVYFQNGKPVAQNQVDRFQPWCEVSFADKSSSFRSLEGGAYEISRLTYDNNYQDNVQVSYTTYMRLSSSTPIKINRISCGHWDDRTGNYLSNDQMQQALQGVMKLELGEK
ncbi:hypothetical protein MNBD_GAMMA21-2291 [hydrothermal vent metagenome]|uniref:Lipoprotein n=1 Tax=hydrothermal vent metagenome TaxID=652676 RepID=A0A3B1ALF8_9ZZZZ